MLNVQPNADSPSTPRHNGMSVSEKHIPQNSSFNLHYLYFQIINTMSSLLYKMTDLTVLLLLAALCFTPSEAFTCQYSSTTRRPVPSSSLYFFGLNNNAAESKGAVEKETAFIVERICRKPNDTVFKDIAEMCINVFFKEQLNAKPEDRVAPWKEAQITYLKNLQTLDLQRRRSLKPKENEMFLAYEVVPVAQDFSEEPLILDYSQVFNLSRDENVEYVRGDLLGFVEITQRPYGLGKPNVIYDDEPEPEVRPILTNLAVRKDVRKYGVGSKLLAECERHVTQGWEFEEIVLEVEDYNTRALDFYEKRGYELLYDDPASRRYDVGGFVLKKVRCTRRVFRKVFSQSGSSSSSSSGDNNTVTIDLDFFKRIKQTVSA